MDYRLTLPGLEGSLDRLPVERSLALANSQIHELFGFNDVARARLQRFARGHDCTVRYVDDCVVFKKMMPHDSDQEPS